MACCCSRSLAREQSCLGDWEVVSCGFGRSLAEGACFARGLGGGWLAAAAAVNHWELVLLLFWAGND